MIYVYLNYPNSDKPKPNRVSHLSKLSILGSKLTREPNDVYTTTVRKIC